MVGLVNIDSLRPAARERVLSNLTRYNVPQFLKLVLTNIRFIWPYCLQDAIGSEAGHMEQGFRQEFLLRVHNLRSFTVMKDFLELHPEFRGEIPQLEPSLTLYRLEDQERLEKLFWTMVRQERAKVAR